MKTDTELRIEMAKALGWTWIKSLNAESWRWKSPNEPSGSYTWNNENNPAKYTEALPPSGLADLKREVRRAGEGWKL